jgi:predicted DNA-binding protein
MEVRLTPDLEAKLNQLSAKTGRAKEELVQDAMAGYLAELSLLRSTLDARYDDIKSGRTKPIDGEEVFTRLRQKKNDHRRG